eukprot:391882-Rhodomonas_salina.2
MRGKYSEEVGDRGLPSHCIQARPSLDHHMRVPECRSCLVLSRRTEKRKSARNVVVDVYDVLAVGFARGRDSVVSAAASTRQTRRPAVTLRAVETEHIGRHLLKTPEGVQEIAWKWSRAYIAQAETITADAVDVYSAEQFMQIPSKDTIDR